MPEGKVQNSILLPWLSFAAIECAWNLNGLTHLAKRLSEQNLWEGADPDTLKKQTNRLVEAGYATPHANYPYVLVLNPSFSTHLKQLWKKQSYEFREKVMEQLHLYYHSFCYGAQSLLRENKEDPFWQQQLQLELPTLVKLFLESLHVGGTYNYLSTLSAFYESNKAWQKFMRVLEKAEAVVEKHQISNRSFIFQCLVGEVYLAMGNVLQEIQRPQEALKRLVKALELYQRLERPYEMGLVFNSIGSAYQQSYQWSDALKAYEASLLAFEKWEMQNPANVGMAANYQPWNSLYERTSTKIRRAQTHQNIGALHATLRKYPVAIEWYEKAYEVYKGFQDKEKMAGLAMNLGELYTEQGKPALSMPWLEQALKNYRELGQSFPQGLVLMAMGNANAELESYDEAQRMYFLAIDIFLSVGERYQLAKVNQSLGWMHLHKYAFQEAIDYLTKALKLYVAFKDNRGIAEVSHSLGAAYYFLGNATKADTFTLRAMELYRALGDEALYQQAKKNLGMNLDSATGEEAQS